MEKEKKNILAIVGSASEKSANEELLRTIAKTFKHVYEINVFHKLRDFPMFRPEDLSKDLSEPIKDFKQQLNAANVVIICTPEYLHNIPAVLKNSLEWITASGELKQKKVLPITFTPIEPRGEHAMLSLLNSLKAMEAEIVTQITLYKNEFKFNNYKVIFSEENKLFFAEALKLLTD
jgi:NAD(P)H-dependent FMN reductase